MIQKLKTAVTNITSQWNRPSNGNLVPYKEIVALGIGGMGQQFVILLMDTMNLNMTSTLLGNTLGLRPMHIQYLLVAQTILGFLFTPVRGKLVDNTRTKWGRFRPYIAVMGFPLVIMTALFIFLPLETMDYSGKLSLAFVFTMAIGLVKPMFVDTYNELITVVTPISEERTKIISINAVMYSLSPTIYNIVLPYFSEYTGGYNNINTYRYILVPMGIIGLALNLFGAFGSKERTVVSKEYRQKINIWQGVGEIFRNKYWWLRTVSGWIGFLEDANRVILVWLFMYDIQNMQPMALLNTVMGTASLIAMLAAPSLLRRFDNRGVLIIHNALNILFLIFMLRTFDQSAYLFAIFDYLNRLVNSLPLVYTSSMHSEVKDYQQYISGKRMDFTFGVAGMISVPVTMLTGFALPYFNERMGLTTNYDVLYDSVIRHDLMQLLCTLSIIGAVINLIPFFFYDLSREKHRNYIRVLRYRAMMEDYEAGALGDDLVVQTVDGAREAFAIRDAAVPDIAQLKAQCKQGTAAEKKQARAALRAGKAMAKEKAEVYIFLDEFDKFEQSAAHAQLAQAGELLAIGMDKLVNIDRSVIDTALALPKKTEEEQTLRSVQLKRAQSLVRMAVNIKKHYPNGIEVPDPQEWERAVAMPEGTREEAAAKKKAVKLADNRLHRYRETLAPYLAAEKLVRQSELGKAVYTEVEARYDSAKENLALEDAAHREKDRLEKENKRAEQELEKQNRKKK